MSQTTISIRMDDTLKKDFDNICNELGMSMTTAIVMMAKKMTREKRLPFDVSIDPFYSEQNMKYLKNAAAALDEVHGVLKTMEELERMENE